MGTVTRIAPGWSTRVCSQGRSVHYSPPTVNVSGSIEQPVDGASVEAGDGVVRIDIPSSVEFVTVVRMIVAAAANAAGVLAPDRLDDLRWVTSEAVTNAIQANLERAEAFDTEPGRVHAACEIGRHGVRLVVRDQGAGLTALPELPDITQPERMMIEGGFGVPLMRHLTRGAIAFDSSDAGTTVTLDIND